MEIWDQLQEEEFFYENLIKILITIDSVKKEKPENLKGEFIKNIFITSTIEFLTK